ncbi:MAG: 2Fe-2S iron-sulfur cluster binding domain-containing protein, partial [Chloroflexi bacterium]|nr:2Fe-2S iron-sulfur cluster binding domain-containing protein [Chloroflexota bacterium]
MARVPAISPCTAPLGVTASEVPRRPIPPARKGSRATQQKTVQPPGRLTIGSPPKEVSAVTEHISLVVNGDRRQLEVEPRRLLVQVIREDLDLTGTHVGCDTSQCGACTVHVDGR